MGEFFRGWRRKAGCVTLVMAVGFMGLWLRSLNVFSQVIFPLTTHDYISLLTDGQSIRIVWECDTDEGSSWSDARHFSMSISEINDIDPEWRTRLSKDNLCLNMPFRLRRRADWVHPQSYSVGTVSIPFWSFTIPLTLASIWLLLSKRRNSTSKKILEPVSEKVK